MKRFLISILIVTHVLINCVWASAHLGSDFDNHEYESPFVHLFTLFSERSDVDNSINYDETAYIHLIYYFCCVDSFNFEQSIVQKRVDIRISFENHALSPPIPLPIV